MVLHFKKSQLRSIKFLFESRPSSAGCLAAKTGRDEIQHLTHLPRKDYSNFACRKPKLHRLVNIICTKLARLTVPEDTDEYRQSTSYLNRRPAGFSCCLSQGQSY